MRLYYFRHSQGIGNFGDDLNPWLWPRLVPGIFDRESPTLFVGIGTLLNDKLPRAERMAVFGSGVGYGSGVPRPDESWNIYCLRGPLSAEALGVAPAFALTDGALLVRKFIEPSPTKRFKYAYMPHFSHAHYGGEGWRRICDDLGIQFIDPRRPVEEVLAQINQTEILLAEAMHGAIVADALRVPWVAIQTHTVINTFKWRDWCQSIGLEHRPHFVPPIWNPPARPSMLHGTYQGFKRKVAAARLRRIARSAKPRLSDDETQRRLLERMEEKLARLRADVDAE